MKFGIREFIASIVYVILVGLVYMFFELWFAIADLSIWKIIPEIIPNLHF